MFKLNGKPLRPGDLAKSLTKAVVENIGEQMRDRIASIRHPDTGEFPTVVVEGDSLENFSMRIEGSPELLTLVRDRLSPKEQQGMDFQERAATPFAFFTYARDDLATAKPIVEALQAAGINTWFDEWDIDPGESIRRAIDKGLQNCTHYIVLLTPASIGKPWVNQEMDAGFVKMLDQKCQVIPLRAGLDVKALPPLLSGMHSPELGPNFTKKDLINTIFGITRKPPLGERPKIASLPRSNHSPAAMLIAEQFVKKAMRGTTGDVQFNNQELLELTGLSRDDLTDGLFELQSYFLESKGMPWHMARASLYAEFDQYFVDHSPEADALKLAADLVNDMAFPHDPQKIANRYGWTPRRLNPALSYLIQRKLVGSRQYMGNATFEAAAVEGTDATRRFVKSRS